MKKTTLLFLLCLMGSYCSAQDINTRALAILQASFDKLDALNTINYRMTFIDSMLREPGTMRHEQTIVNGITEKRGYWHLLFEDQSRWLIKGDTLYKRIQPNTDVISYTTDWNSHELSKYSVFNILGTQRPALDEKSTASLTFAQDTLVGDYYVIKDMHKTRNYQSDEVQDIAHYDTYWIDKKTLLPVRRKMYGESRREGKQAIDIYDFKLSFDPINRDEQLVSKFFNQVRKIEKVSEPEQLELGSIAPKFTAKDVSNNKTVTLDGLKGKVILLDFWYLSCWPCRELTPKIQKLHEQFAGQDVAIIGINVIDKVQTEIAAFLNKKMITFPQYYNTGALAQAYKLYAYPTTMIIGKDGTIKFVEVGLADDSDKKMEQVIKNELQLSPNLKN